MVASADRALRGMTLAQKVAMMPNNVREQFMRSLTVEEKTCLLYKWDFWARPEQTVPDGDWRAWLIMAGRGWGKTRTGVEFVRHCVEKLNCNRIALVARTAADARDVMVEGESGILACSPPWCRPEYQPSKRRLIWPNGAIATTYSGDEPDQLRGPQHDAAWADELASWRCPETWDMLQFGLRLGLDPRVVVTTTPKPTKLIKELRADPSTHVTRGSTYDNVNNLADAFIQTIIKKYEGTRLGRQELAGEILDDNPAALWKRDHIDQYRLTAAPALDRIVVAADPEASDGESSAETGIVVAGTARIDGTLHGYVLADRTVKGTPNEWAKEVIKAYDNYAADRVVAEVNNGGAMVENTIRSVRSNVPYTGVWASRGKATRAEPISALYEQGRVHHCGVFAELEDQQCDWEPGMPSPDRLDALVWALTELMLGEEQKSKRLMTLS